jgi:phospholipid/cholesterol/gamma-HCH transport system ATP-binding protein
MPEGAAPETNGTPIDAPPVIEVTDVVKTFNDRNVLDGVSLTVRRGETLVIMGASGCGKSTLLRCLIGAHRIDEGTVKLFGKDIMRLRQRELDAVRKRYGILFQSGALFSSMTVGENVALPLKEHARLSADMIDLMVKVKLELVGLREAEDRLPSEISGGMAKRAGLARAIALDPELLFYDEPTSGLDPIMTETIDSLIIDLARTMNVTSVVVTHDLKSAFRVADRMVVLNSGRIVLQGLPNEIRASNDPFVRRFIHGPTESRTAVIQRPGSDRGSRAAFEPHPSAPIGATLVTSSARLPAVQAAEGAGPPVAPVAPAPHLAPGLYIPKRRPDAAPAELGPASETGDSADTRYEPPPTLVVPHETLVPLIPVEQQDAGALQSEKAGDAPPPVAPGGLS